MDHLLDRHFSDHGASHGYEEIPGKMACSHLLCSSVTVTETLKRGKGDGKGDREEGNEGKEGER